MFYIGEEVLLTNEGEEVEWLSEQDLKEGVSRWS